MKEDTKILIISILFVAIASLGFTYLEYVEALKLVGMSK
jgi:hypothetical protein